jgi:hypothetical protein
MTGVLTENTLSALGNGGEGHQRVGVPPRRVGWPHCVIPDAVPINERKRHSVALAELRHASRGSGACKGELRF